MQKYIILILIIFFISCVNQQNKSSHFTEEQIASLHLDFTTILHTEIDSVIKVDLNPFLKRQSFDFGSLVKEIKLIPLETTDESLLDVIYKVIATDSHIYIYDRFKGGGIAIFDREGEFIIRISYGQGPGELIRLYDIAYDADNDELVAYQHSFLLFFTASGQFIRKTRLPFGFYNLAVIPDGYIFKALDGQGNGHLGLLGDYTLFVTDKNFKLKSVAIPVLSDIVNYGGYNYLYPNNNAIKITQKYTDTVYHYISETNRLEAKYIMDYSKKKLPERYIKGSMNEFESATTQNDYYYHLGEYLETISQNTFFLKNDFTGLQTIVYRDKNTGNLTGGTDAICDDRNEIPAMTFPVATSDNWFISFYFPDKNDSLLYNSSIITEEDKEKLKGLSEDDNPVLVFFQLKDF
ncbi:MAG: 6-bladed beta-propeller [Tannerella sp.]|jgi:hypothetical protein|nr:6-bladed beta-propeller [Tannerella sp.]